MTAFFAALAGGAVLAADGPLGLPPVVVGGAALVALVGVLMFFAAAWSDARTSGGGALRAAGRAVRQAARLVGELF